MKIDYKIFRLPLIAVIIIWLVFLMESFSGFNFARFGIYPKDLKGLLGIPLNPLIHGSLEHLYNNSAPLFVLLAMMQFFYKKQTYFVIIVGVLLSGFITWFIGRPSFHIGASGLIYALVSFIFFKGIISKNYQLSALSFIIIFLYGGMIWFMFPDMKDGMSWEGHLGGFISGLFLSFIVDTPEEYKKIHKYEWEKPDFNRYQDPFMKHFDEKGNFVSNPHIHTSTDENIKFKYVYMKEEEENNTSENSEITNP